MMLASLAKWTLFIVLSSPHVFCDFDCVCNYAVETSVYGSADTNGQPIGYLYEFDCKPSATGNQAVQNFYAVQFEKQLGYVKKDASQIQIQTCPGDIPDADLIPAAQTTPGDTFPTTTAISSEKPTTSPSNAATLPTVAATTATSLSSSSLPFTIPPGYWSEANVTGTPYEYIGVGYNTLVGNPESSTDPGLKTTERIFQLTGNGSHLREATSQSFNTCAPTNSRTVVHGSKSYQDELKLFVDTSPSHITQIQDLMFAYSPDFQAMRPALDNDTLVYLDFISSCKLGSSRFLTEEADKRGFKVSREFAKDVCALPSTFDSEAYMHFLDKWGTSIVTSVDVGTRVIDRYQTTPSQLFQHAQQKQPELLEHTGSYNGYASSISINAKDYASSPAGSGKFGVASHISFGTNDHPVPIALKVVPIYNALNWTYWQPIMDELAAEGICSDSLYGTGVAHYAAFLKTALNQYPEYKAKGLIHTALTDYHLQVPITWPTGTYGLMQTAHGCPGAKTSWSTGWRKQDTEDLRSHNSYSSGINTYLKAALREADKLGLHGEFASNDIKTYYCVKTSQSGSQYDQSWSKGSYCLLKYGSCPNGFSSGYIYWDDEDINNGNSKGGTLPDGTYDKNTRIYYCCRNDASPQTPLILPTDTPFVLLRFGNTCQAVHGMNVQDLFIKWDDEDISNKDRAGGMHPLDDGGSKDHKLHFCYYRSSNSPFLIG